MSLLDANGELDERIRAAHGTADPVRQAIAEQLADVVGAFMEAEVRYDSMWMRDEKCGHIYPSGAVCDADRAESSMGCHAHPEGRPVWIDKETRWRGRPTAEKDALEEAKKAMVDKKKACAYTEVGRKPCRVSAVKGTDFCFKHGGNLVIMDMAATIARKKACEEAVEASVEPVKGTKGKMTRLVESYLGDPDLLNTRVQVAQAKATLDIVQEELSRAIDGGEFSKDLVQLMMAAIDGVGKQVERLENIESKKVLTAAHVLRLNNDLKTLITAAPETFRPYIISWVEQSMFGTLKALPEAEVASVVPSYLEAEVVE